jgi:hypothetical protein
MMPNLPNDLSAITGLLDRIPVFQGGSKEFGGVWSTERNALIAQVTAQIVTFQTTNGRPVIDGVVDPGGGSLRMMNQLAAASGPAPSGGITATVEPNPNGLFENSGARNLFTVFPAQMPGLGRLDPNSVNTEYIRKFVRVEGSSIKWFGVVFRSTAGSISNGIPHINFTPTPIQGGYNDATYSTFGGWAQLWDDYTEVIGSQVAAAGVDQILVLPFYKTSQSNNLGNFLENWREVIKAVIEAAIFSTDIFLLRDGYKFEKIVSSSFSNGWVAHNNFNTKAVGAGQMTEKLYDLDGVAGGSNWTPPNGLIYRNRSAPVKVNPVGNIWYVGGRWGPGFAPLYGGQLNTHAACRNHLLYHGLSISK